MGLGAHEDGHCSTCDIAHLRPWGNQCVAYKSAIEKCTELNIDESESKKYLDANLLRFAKDLPPSGVKHDERAADEIKQLKDINRQQKDQIEALMDQMSGMKSLPPPPDHSNILQQIVQRLYRLEHNQTPPLQNTAFSAAGAVKTGQAAVSAPVSGSPDMAATAMGQMAAAMAQLSISIDPSSAKPQGQLLRPEYHVCVIERGMPIKQSDASKLTINEYLYGTCLVMCHLVETNGDWKSYMQHFKRIMKFFVGKKYINAAYIAYDKEVVDSYLKEPSLGFNASDSLAVPTHFCSANEHDTQNYRNRAQKRIRPQNQKGNTPMQSQPEDWPEEACFLYNTSFCNGACGKQHVCGKCLLRGHRVATCHVKSMEKN